MYCIHVTKDVDQWQSVVYVVKSGSCTGEKHIELMRVCHYIILGNDTRNCYLLQKKKSLEISMIWSVFVEIQSKLFLLHPVYIYLLLVRTIKFGLQGEGQMPLQ